MLHDRWAKMDALGLNTSQSNVACGSLQDLRDHLHQLLAAKTTDTRAEHVSAGLEIQPHATFLVPASENGATNGADTTQSQPESSTARTVIASEALQNQSPDDPVLQRTVAGLIVNAVSAVDGSGWTLRQMTRGAHGWQFAYNCKDSLKAWNHAHAKGPQRPPIGSYSNSNMSGLDAINFSRPAFDCRGTLSIVFYNSSRGIVIKYEHTPLHKTVTQLVERLEPAPTPVPINNRNGNNKNTNGSQRTPRPVRARRSLRSTQTPQGDEENGGESRKKRRKTTNNIPETSVEERLPESQRTSQDRAPSDSQTTRATSTGLLNVPPEEAERRRKTAIELLTGKGIDPNTLSPEQFSIFANQAPSLQTSSLEMLAKYGAERLRIVHPEEKSPPAPSKPTPAPEPVAHEPPVAAPPVAPATEPATEPPPPPIPTTVPQQGPTPVKPKNITSGRCQTCRQRKAKCDKEYPSCSTCIEAGVECVYLPVKKRRVRVNGELIDADEAAAQGITISRKRKSMPDASEPTGPVASQSPPHMENGEHVPESKVPLDSTEDQSAEHQTVEDQPMKDQPVEHEPVEDQSMEDQPVEHEPVEDQPIEHQPIEHETVERQTVQHQAVEEQSVEHHLPIEQQPIEHQPVHRPIEHQRVEDQSAGHH
ncbi:hypothetical protein GGR50DRAFT_332773 [Xylaria sp. CBS 124048]|nr:hypothetical protein GGR50DRAFT_332773 [Xylaria sp. CBS 124048]